MAFLPSVQGGNAQQPAEYRGNARITELDRNADPTPNLNASRCVSHVLFKMTALYGHPITTITALKYTAPAGLLFTRRWAVQLRITPGTKSSPSSCSASGTILFLALISYTPRDVPSWVWFSQVSSPNRPAQNFIGPFGAILAGFCYLLMGAASYLLAAVLLGFGGAKLFHPGLRVSSRIIWIALLIVSGACLLQLQTSHLIGWKSAFNIPGPGGWIGYFFGRTILLNSMGKVGSLVLFGGIYAASLILTTGLRPIHLVRQTVAASRAGMVRLREWRLRQQMRKSDLKGQLEISQKQLAKQRRVY